MERKVSHFGRNRLRQNEHINKYIFKIKKKDIRKQNAENTQMKFINRFLL